MPNLWSVTQRSPEWKLARCSQKAISSIKPKWNLQPRPVLQFKKNDSEYNNYLKSKLVLKTRKKMMKETRTLEIMQK